MKVSNSLGLLPILLSVVTCSKDPVVVEEKEDSEFFYELRHDALWNTRGKDVDWITDGFDRPVYGKRDYDKALAKAYEFTSSLNHTEKIGMVTGSILGTGCTSHIKPIERVGFKGLCMLDGPTGVNRNELVSVFPAGLTLAATWDKDHFEDRAKAIGKEFRGKGAQIALGPSIGPLGRHPLGGRNWESFSPDPYLSASIVYYTVRGIQKQGVQTATKHFIGNEQETQRNIKFHPNGTTVPGISSNIDDRTLHELYLWPFVDAIRAGTTSIMCSYNQINGTYACENDELLNGILRKELGFDGYVMSDWFAIHSTDSVNAGLDMDPPGVIERDYLETGESYFGANITKAIADGVISEERLDEMVRRIITPYFYLDQDNGKFPSPDPSMRPVQAALYEADRLEDVAPRNVRNNGRHADLIRKIAADGTVMLKNIDNALPLKSPKNIGVFGNDAADLSEGLVGYDEGPAWGPNIGTLDIGGGSGTGRHTTIVAPLEAIKAKARETAARVQYITENSILAANDFRSIYPTPEVCLVFLKTYAGEALDRASFENDWNSTLVVENVARLCPNTIVITHSAGVNTMPWANHPNVTAILAAHYPGEESGNAIVDILWGDVQPSGKLPYTIPKSTEDYDIPIVYPTDENRFDGLQADFSEGMMIDYRHFDANDIEPLYEFGFGLTYATFSMASEIGIEKISAEPHTPFPDENLPIAPGGNMGLFKALYYINTTVTNLSPIDSTTVAQLYLSFPESAGPGTPVKVLRGFEKMWLGPEEQAEMLFVLQRRDVSFWDVEAQQWRIPEGEFTVHLGFSSRDVRARGRFRVLDEDVEEMVVEKEKVVEKEEEVVKERVGKDEL